MIRCGITTTPKILVYLLVHPGTTAPVPRALARRAPLLGRRAPVVGRRDRFALAGIGGGGIEATRAGAWHSGGIAFPIPRDAEGHAALTPHLKRSQDHAAALGYPGTAEEREAYRQFYRFCENWNVGAMLLCTRKRDGVTVQLARLDQGLCEKEGINSAVDRPGPYGSLNFYGGYNGGRPLDVGFHTYSGLEHIDWNVNLVFDRSTGKLRYVTGYIWAPSGDMDEVSDEYLRTYLHAKCDYMSRQTRVPAKWSMQENRYVPSSP